LNVVANLTFHFYFSTKAQRLNFSLKAHRNEKSLFQLFNMLYIWLKKFKNKINSQFLKRTTIRRAWINLIIKIWVVNMLIRIENILNKKEKTHIPENRSWKIKFCSCNNKCKTIRNSKKIFNCNIKNRWKDWKITASLITDKNKFYGQKVALKSLSYLKIKKISVRIKILEIFRKMMRKLTYHFKFIAIKSKN